MNFARPEALYILLLLPALAALMWWWAKKKEKVLARFGNPELLERAGMSVAGRLRLSKSLVLLISLGIIILALAGPQWGATREKIERKGVDVVVALDTSLSMLSEDVAPSRMTKAKQAIEKLIELMKGDRISIVAFSGTAITMCPLTLDYSAARMFVDVIDTTSVPIAGTDVADALRVSAENFQEESEKYKVIILISDGEHLEGEGDNDPVKVAEQLAERGVKIYTVGVGTPEGGSIPLDTPQGRIDKTDRQGNVVITRLDESGLRKITLAGDGKYRRIDNNATGNELAQIYEGVSGMEKKTFEEQYQVHFEDRFQYFIAAALLLLVVEALIPDSRRRKK